MGLASTASRAISLIGDTARRLGAIAVFSMVGSLALAAPVLRPWTPEDSVGFTYYVANQESPLELVSVADQSPIVPSPDGKWFFLVTHRGDIESDSTIFELQIFSVKEVIRRLVQNSAQKTSVLAYRTVIRRSFSSTDPGLKDAQWDESSSSVLFQGLVDQSAKFQVFRLDLKSGAVEQLTNEPQEIRWFKAHGDYLLFWRFTPAVPPPLRYPMEPVRRNRYDSIATPGTRSVLDAQRAFYIEFRGKPPHEFAEALNPAAWISPDGRSAIAILSTSVPYRFARIDITQTQVVPVLDTPFGPARVVLKNKASASVAPRSALWSSDSAHVVLVNTTIPKLENKDEFSGSGSYIVDYEIRTSRWRILEPMIVDNTEGGQHSDGAKVAVSRYVGAVEEVIPGKEFVIRYRDENGQERGHSAYEFKSDGWVKRRTRSGDAKVSKYPLLSGLSIALNQDPNTPPYLVASYRGREVELIRTDPALSALVIAETTQFEWASASGEKKVAGLTLPRDFRPGSRVPLVIQPYFYFPRLFLPDGVNSSSHATQALASRGFAVLQLDMFVGNQISSVRSDLRNEGEKFIDLVGDAVDALAKQGIVDPMRVGLTGFSRAGYRVLYAITHPRRVPFAAAICDDSFTGSYASYLADAADKGEAWVQDNFETGPGGPFWRNKFAWLEYETTFNVDRVETPVMFTTHGTGPDPYVPFNMQVLGAFQLNRKPLEYLFFPNAAHGLIRPRERLAMMDSVVDWMDFWLQNYEDPNPQKEEQYKRWRVLRQQFVTARSESSLEQKRQ